MPSAGALRDLKETAVDNSGWDHRDALGNRTLTPVGAATALCGHPVLADALQDERCAYCVDYEDARRYDAAATALERAA